MNCDGALELLSAYLDRELAPGELLRVEQHLRRCQSCAAEVDSLRQTISFVSSLEEVPLPADFHAGLHARLIAQGPPVARRASIVRPWQRHMRGWASAAAAAAVLATGLAGYQLISRSPAGLEVQREVTFAPKQQPNVTQVPPVTGGGPIMPPDPGAGGGTGKAGTGGSAANTTPPTTSGNGQVAQNPKGSGTGSGSPVPPNPSTPVGPAISNPGQAQAASFLDGVAAPEPTRKLLTTTYSLQATAADPQAALAEVQKLFPGTPDPQGNVLTLSVAVADLQVTLANIKAKLGPAVQEAPPVDADLSYVYESKYQTLQSLENQRVQLKKAADTTTDPGARDKAAADISMLKKEADKVTADLSRTLQQTTKATLIVTVKPAP